MAAAPRAGTLPLRVLQVVRERALWAPGDRVALSVSGGADSVALLDALHRTAGAHGGRLSVVSFDHGLRPASADEVAAVGAMAKARGLPFRAVALALRPGPGLMVRARDARRAHLAACGADRLATGHHADDHAETVLQRLSRGAGLAGVSALRPRDGRWVRPLLFERKAALRAYLRSVGAVWVEDPSNPHTERGRLRRILDELEAVRPGATAGLARTARLLADDAALLEALADAAWARCARGPALCLDALRAEPPALARRLLLRLAAPADAHPRADRIEAVLNARFAGAGEVQLGGGWSLVAEGGLLRLQAPG